MELHDLSGEWICRIPGQTGCVVLPGTLDEAGLGNPDDPERQWHLDNARAIGLYRDGDPITTRLTRRCTYEGPAVLERLVEWTVPEKKRVFLECERARQLKAAVNGVEVRPYSESTLSTPWIFEVTGLLTGRDLFTLTSDNSYTGWPYKAIISSSAVTDQAQTNWNGILGHIRLRAEERTFISDVRVYPRGETADICVEIDASEPIMGIVTAVSDAFQCPAEMSLRGTQGILRIWLRGVGLRSDIRRWESGDGYLSTVTVSIPGLESRTVRFGVRDFLANNGALTLNGHRVFLRGEANCAVFPETGYPPMDVPSWREILRKYQGYGVNCMRFHSYCPPEAAFEAADEMGMMMQPELSHWDSGDAFEGRESREYYREELFGILRTLANHPSFVMITLGNELHPGDEGTKYAAQLLQAARDYDPTRLYANGSNTYYGRRGQDDASDFYTAGSYKGRYLRATYGGMKGWLNDLYPDLRVDYSEAVKALRTESSQPVFSFEVGQFEVLPDFDELRLFCGTTVPDNLRAVQARAAQAGMVVDWKKRVEATGELSLLCYRAEVEAALRTEGLSGISLLGLQDFPGQGTALVGMMNSHLEAKPYPFAEPSRFQSFFRDVVPLVLLPRVTFVNGETLIARLRLANYSKEDLTGTPEWRIAGESVTLDGVLPETTGMTGGLSDLGTLTVRLKSDKAVKLTVTVSFCGYKNEYSIWVYPDEEPVCPDTVHECRYLDDNAAAILAAGGRIYLSPPSVQEALPGSVKCHFSPDFWSVGSFSAQSGTMGQLIDVSHPLFRDFPTDVHTDWQWWPMANQRAVRLPRDIKPIIAELDSYALMRPLTQLAEFNCGGGRLLLSALGLQDLREYPEARALQTAIYRYMASEDFEPVQELNIGRVRSVVRSV